MGQQPYTHYYSLKMLKKERKSTRPQNNGDAVNGIKLLHLHFYSKVFMSSQSCAIYNECSTNYEWKLIFLRDYSKTKMVDIKNS